MYYVLSIVAFALPEILNLNFLLFKFGFNKIININSYEIAIKLLSGAQKGDRANVHTT